MAHEPRNTFDITHHDDMTVTVIHNGEDISHLIESIGIQWERHDMGRVTVTFVDCKIEAR